ncbi:MAG: enterochelin esterase [Verrucomicrobiae bacterium]|nr:enterochelin esterase [Verrucomicrobiae bacterium]
MSIFHRPLAFLMLASLLGSIAASRTDLSAQEKKPWSPPPAIALEKLIPENPSEAAALIRKSWGDKAFESNNSKVIEKTTVLWVGKAETPISVVRLDTGETIGTMTDLGGFQALAKTLPNCVTFDYELRATGKDKALGKGNLKIEYYDYTPDSLEQPGVPRGTVTEHEWNDSKIFPDTAREYVVYIPAQYDGSKPAALMVFQDGLRHADPKTSNGLHATTVLDNLIAKGEVPVTVAIFINPGRTKDQKPGDKARNRSFEYDSLGDAYVRFLLEEIIPHVVSEHDLKLSDDPAMWAISGGSSGCACAWTAAWERPDKFGKVLGWVGTFTNIRGANVYPALVRKTERKPIRAALLDGTNDVDNQFGNWPLANRQMEAALKFSGYDYRYWWGEGFHGSTYAAAMLPEMMRWLWRDDE